MTNKKFFGQILFLALIGGLFISGAAWAETNQGGEIFNSAYEKLMATFKNVRPIVYALSGFGLIGVAVGGIMGKIKWAWLASITAALAILAMADQFIAAATDTTNTAESSIDLSGDSDFDLSGGRNDFDLNI